MQRSPEARGHKQHTTAATAARQVASGAGTRVASCGKTAAMVCFADYYMLLNN